MWIATTDIGFKKVVSLLGGVVFMVYVSHFFVPQAYLWGTSVIGGCLIFLLALCFYHGIVIRLQRFTLEKKTYEVRDYISFRSPQDSFRYIVHEASGLLVSSLKFHTAPPWAYFDIVRAVIKKSAANFLILGGGGGAVALTIAREIPIAHIDVVELYVVMIAIAQRYFLTQNSLRNRIYIHQKDAFTFVQQARKLYDFVFVDIFQGGALPKGALQAKFVRKLPNLLNTGGTCVINFGLPQHINIKHIYNTYCKAFPAFTLYLWHGVVVGVNSKPIDIDKTAILYS